MRFIDIIIEFFKYIFLQLIPNFKILSSSHLKIAMTKVEMHHNNQFKTTPLFSTITQLSGNHYKLDHEPEEP